MAVGVALALAGCGAGQITQTDTQLPAVNGSQAVAGQLTISNVALSFPQGEDKFYPAGSDVPLTLTIANRGGKADQLVAVKASIAEKAQITGDKVIAPRRALQVIAPAARKSGASATKTPAHGETPHGETPAHGEATASSAPAEPTATSANPDADADSASDSGEIGIAQIVLKSITQDLRPGQVVRLTLIFRDAGEVTLTAPIAAPAFARSPEPHEGEAGH